MNKLKAIRKKLEGRLVDKIDFSDMEDSYKDSHYRKFMEELAAWQQEAEKIITDSGVILSGDIQAGSLHNGDAEKIRLPLKLPVSKYDMQYIRNTIELLIAIKQIQKQLVMCEGRDDRQKVIDLFNLGRSFRWNEVTFHYPQITTDVIHDKNRQIARLKKGTEGPVKKMVRIIGEKQPNPSLKSIINIYRWVREEKLQVIKTCGGHNRIPRSELERIMTARKAAEQT